MIGVDDKTLRIHEVPINRLDTGESFLRATDNSELPLSLWANSEGM